MRWYLFCTVAGLSIKNKWLIVTITVTATATIVTGTYYIMCDIDMLTGKFTIV